jgi:hypothetical protein
MSFVVELGLDHQLAKELFYQHHLLEVLAICTQNTKTALAFADNMVVQIYL